MTVSTEQWETVADELGLSVEELYAAIVEFDSHFEDRQYPCEFDRDGDRLTIGQWSMLYEARSYQRVKASILPSFIWIATIWQGIHHHLDGDPPMIFETAVFWLLNHDSDTLPPPLYTVPAATEADALANHERLIREWARASPQPNP